MTGIHPQKQEGDATLEQFADQPRAMYGQNFMASLKNHENHHQAHADAAQNQKRFG